MNTEIINLFIQIFILIAIGFILTKLKLFTNEMKSSISGFLLNCILPISIINSSQLEYSSADFSAFITCFIFSLVSLSLTVLLVPKVLMKFKIKPHKAKATGMMLAFSNSAFMGFAISQELYGEHAVGYNIGFNLVLFSLGISLISGDEKFSWKSFFKKIITTPAMVASVAGLILYLIPYRLPEVAQSALSSAASIMMPASVLIIGCELAMIKLSKIFLTLGSYIISAVRLIVIPLLTAFILSLLRLDPTIIAVCTVLTAMPAGTTNVILATQYDCAPEFTTVATTQTMIWMIVVTPLIINLVNNWILV